MCSDCQLDKPIYAKGLCITCYKRSRKRANGVKPRADNSGPCASCGKVNDGTERFKRQLCNRCYKVHLNEEHGISPSDTRNYAGPCIACGSETPGSKGYFLNKLCYRCWSEDNRRKKGVKKQLLFKGPCTECGTLDPKGLYTHQLCMTCYQRSRRRNQGMDIRPEKGTGPCVLCRGTESPNGRFVRGMCSICYNRIKSAENYARNKGSKGLCKDCGQNTHPEKLLFAGYCPACYAALSLSKPFSPTGPRYTGPCIVCDAIEAGDPTGFINKMCHRCQVQQEGSIKRARRRKVECTLTPTEWREIVDAYECKCAYCHKTFSRDRLTIDHVKPISKLGGHTKENVVPACFSCNASKKDREKPTTFHTV